MFYNFRRFDRICSVISVGSVRFGSVTGFIHSPQIIYMYNVLLRIKLGLNKTLLFMHVLQGDKLRAKGVLEKILY